eukprot:scaffold1440_cov332-Pavlova_lutheri.AAC.61
MLLEGPSMGERPDRTVLGPCCACCGRRAALRIAPGGAGLGIYQSKRRTWNLPRRHGCKA